MRIFLGNIPWYTDNLYGVRAGSRWPHFQKRDKEHKIPLYMPFPFFLSYATALLEKENFEVLLVDAIAEGFSREEFIAKIEDFKPDILFFETSTPTINYDLRFVDTLKKQGIKAEIIFAGPHSEMFKADFLKANNQIDYVLVGEYEETLKELVLALKEDNTLESVDGLIWRDSLANVIVNKNRALIKDIDALPYPARHFLPMESYRDLVCGLPEPSLQLWASRGCPYGCIFCFWPQMMYHGRNYRTRDPRAIVDELEAVLEKYKFKSFYFDDDTFNIGKPRIIELCREIKKRKINLPWAIMARADTMDTELLTELKAAGLYSLKYGMESVVQEIVDKSGKNLDLKKAQDIVDETKKLGIKVHLTFSFGLPGETKETIDKTINKIIDLNPDTVQFSIITPFPGSQYFDILKEKGLITSYNWDDYNGSVSAVFSTEHLTPADLDDALVKASHMWNKRYHLNDKFRGQFFQNLEAQIKEKIFSIKEVKKIFVIRSSFIEHAISSITILRKIFKGVQIDVLVQETAASEIKQAGGQPIIYPKKDYDNEVDSLQLMAKLAGNSYDLAVILCNNPTRYGYGAVEDLCFGVKAKKTIGICVEGDVQVIEFDKKGKVIAAKISC